MFESCDHIEVFVGSIVVGILDLQTLVNFETGGSSGTTIQTTHDCESGALQSAIANTNVALALDGLNNNSTHQVEYGNAIVHNGGQFSTGHTTNGESYNDHNPPRLGIQVPDGFEWSDVNAVLHYLPTSPSSTTDANYRKLPGAHSV